MHKFLGFDFEIQYKPGAENIPADTLSRSLAMAWSQLNVELIQNIKKAIGDDPELMILLQQCYSQTQLDKNFSAKNGLLFWKERLFIPHNQQLV